MTRTSPIGLCTVDRCVQCLLNSLSKKHMVLQSCYQGLDEGVPLHWSALFLHPLCRNLTVSSDQRCDTDQFIPRKSIRVDTRHQTVSRVYGDTDSVYRISQLRNSTPNLIQGSFHFNSSKAASLLKKRTITFCRIHKLRLGKVSIQKSAQAPTTPAVARDHRWVSPRLCGLYYSSRMWVHGGGVRAVCPAFLS